MLLQVAATNIKPVNPYEKRDQGSSSLIYGLQVPSAPKKKFAVPVVGTNAQAVVAVHKVNSVPVTAAALASTSNLSAQKRLFNSSICAAGAAPPSTVSVKAVSFQSQQSPDARLSTSASRAAATEMP